ncbi:PREDICTED: short-chain dehydrogenase/reductase family 16C member 6-like [Vollenhovia emeryi]|uniref:short-chain dehydrogenase/reductase family 16C member 6-like n=1 Tax=Vollenhovia emeryi TaxID=411798 RepID=UPI0005F3C308|nr:PREDICTED: short-chain dehydrogenase/reductase family 16C member 6-like [Vollenhovia emeryi]
MVKIYDVLLFLAEILLLILKVVYYICEDIYRFIVPAKEKSVAGEIVLITGAGHGIGKKLAIGYASLGATVICWDINEETNNETMNVIKRMGKDVYAYRVPPQYKLEKYIYIYIIKFVQSAVYKYMKKYYFQMLKAFLPSMIEKNHGHIVALSSLAALVSLAHGTVYCPSKCAVQAITATMFEELRILCDRKSSIKFTTIYPSLVLTGFLKQHNFRHPWLFNRFLILSPQKAATLIINAQRRNYENESLPSWSLPFVKIMSLLPDKAIKCILDFAGITVVLPND